MKHRKYRLLSLMVFALLLATAYPANNARATSMQLPILKSFVLQGQTFEYTNSQSIATFTGQAITVSDLVFDITPNLLAGVDYDLSYEYNVNAGEEVTYFSIIGKGLYNYSLRHIHFEIRPKALPTMVAVQPYNPRYTGSAIEPGVFIIDPDRNFILVEGVDYTVSYQDNINSGQGVIIVTGKGNYQETRTAGFDINPIGMPSITDVSPDVFVYDGSAKQPVVSVAGLVEGKDFTVSYTNNVVVGRGTAYATGIGNYSGNAIASFSITPAALPDALTLLPESFVYSGQENRPSVSLAGLVEGADFTVSYADNVNAGQAKATANGIGNYQGAVSKPFDIKKANLPFISYIDRGIGRWVYDGNAKEPAVSIDGLTQGVDYALTYRSNINAGQGIATVTGMGNYQGQWSEDFAIDAAALPAITEISPAGFVYDGTAKQPVVGITGLVEGTDYTVSYANNVNAGQGTATVTGIRNYTGTATVDFAITPAALPEGNTLDPDSFVYDGIAKQPVVSITGLVEGTD